MGLVEDTVYYCCVAKGKRILYTYSNGDQEIENLGALCVEKAPQFHKRYFETIKKRTYGYLLEDGFVYFTIVDEDLGNEGALRFLQHVRDEFKNLNRNSLKGSFSSLNSVLVQEQLVPVIRSLISSLEKVDRSQDRLTNETSSNVSPSQSNAKGQNEVSSSTKSPLLGKSSKREKKTKKDHIIAVELEEHRKSTERAARVDTANLGSNNQGMIGSSMSERKDMGSMRVRSASPNIRRKWWRLVRIVLAIDVAVCVILFCIWLAICHGFECTR